VLAVVHELARGGIGERAGAAAEAGTALDERDVEVLAHKPDGTR
jgi:hypothetical protein